ncbi:presequence translocated-associated motor subunit PAM17 [Aspergillus ruber CBS 135680]|uniref:Presequence translocated-associated motor subunit PAM17 n=1 Tax=Aspergillus ruber (strain CBS 135680) TaxID=1388766 RepID=A0A017S9X0_ASPRC|nr:putative presequence translocase-associated motor subunit Pam17 [Aspergillus ruber CBS 135680]EYE93732.1 putative presequence translocase-associated motor subunit Pam17 [Aspergillus ruber CBS 135680]
MNAVSICAPMRTAMLRGRISPAALASPKTPFQVRMGSTTSTRTTTPTIQSSMLLQTYPRPQNKSLPGSCVLRTMVRANSTSAPPTNEAKLDWNSFFKLRATRRRYSVASSAMTSVVTTVFGVQYLSTQDIESLGAQVMGLDPIVVLGMSTMACGAVGWLLGPFVGNGFWSLVNRKYTAAFARKEKEFFDRIRRFRVDPSSNSIANPVPDYYGEKIGSVQGYRSWLKDQRAYNRKRRSFIV